MNATDTGVCLRAIQVALSELARIPGFHGEREVIGNQIKLVRERLLRPTEEDEA